MTPKQHNNTPFELFTMYRPSEELIGGGALETRWIRVPGQPSKMLSVGEAELWADKNTSDQAVAAIFKNGEMRAVRVDGRWCVPERNIKF